MNIIRRPIYHTLRGRPYFNRYGRNYIDDLVIPIISLTDTEVTLEVF